MLAASSGARRGELLALRWSDIDLDRGRLSIERGIVRVGDDLIEQGTKTHQSRRISLDAGTVAALRAHEERMIEPCSGGLEYDHVRELCLQPFGRRLVTLASRLHVQSFRRICQQAGVKAFGCTISGTTWRRASLPPAWTSVPSPGGWVIGTRARLSMSIRTSSRKPIKKPRRRLDESLRMPTAQHLVSCSARILLVWLPQTVGTSVRTLAVA